MTGAYERNASKAMELNSSLSHIPIPVPGLQELVADAEGLLRLRDGRQPELRSYEPTWCDIRLEDDNPHSAAAEIANAVQLAARLTQADAYARSCIVPRDPLDAFFFTLTLYRVSE